MERTGNKGSWYSRFQSFAMNRMAPPQVMEEDSLMYWRVRILFSILFASSVFSFISLVPVFILVNKNNLWVLGICDIAAWFIIIMLMLARNIRFEIRSAITLVLTYLLGLVIILNVGILSGGPLFLFGFAVIAGIFRGTRAVFLSLALNAITLTIIGWMISTGRFGQSFPFFKTSEAMMASLTTFMLLNIAVAVSVRVLVEGLSKSNQQQKELLNNLKSEQLRLENTKIMLELEVEKQQQAEEALRESENKFRSFAEQSLVGIYLNQDGVLKYVNPKFAEIFGYTVEECSKNMFFRDLVYPEDYVIVKEQVRKRLSGETQSVNYAVRGIKKTGEVIHVEIFGSLIMFNGRPTITGTILDITDRKLAEDALRESEKKYRLVLETNPDPMIVYDIEGKVTYLNPAFMSVFGWSPEERIGKKMDDFVPEESWPETQMMIDMVIAGKSFSGIETIRLTSEGKMVPVSISGSCYRNQEGNIEASVINLRDITERKLAEAEKKKLEEQYLQAQKMEAIGQLAGGVAHDFNNMLNIILGYSQMALMKIGPSSPISANIQEIMNAAQRSADLVRQLLAFARKQTIAPKVLDLNDTVAGMLNMLRKLIGEDIDLLWMPAANLWQVKMDPAQVDQIVANLAVNARDSISGVGKITIETGKAEFDETYCAQHDYFSPGHYAMLAVSDNGCGMDKDICEKIFEPFFTTKEIGKGTGMGLATVYGIVKQNNGFINVYSEPGKGTTFKVYMPRLKDEGKAIDEPCVQARHLTGTETVLLVEDEKMLLEMGKIMLEELGYKVLAADSPDEAIKLAEQYADDLHLVVTDVVMPGMSGRDLQRRLSALLPSLRFLFMSGYTADVIAHRGIIDEGVHFLQKPFLMSDLADKVLEALEK